MMPPKKSKAAREMDNDSSAAGKGLNGDAEVEEPERNNVDIFKVEILASKRERTVPQCETVFIQWINDNFDDKEGVNLNFGDIYEHYLDMCSLKGCNAVEQHRFVRVVKETFPTGFTVKESSVMFGDVKERKIAKKHPKVEGETMKLKMRDLVTEQLESMGNPRTGVRFNMLVKLIGAKYPALRLDVKPKQLLTCLDNGVRYGHMYVTKGVGKCGFYRLWKEGMEDEDDQEDDKKKVKKEKKNGEKEASAEGEGSADDGEKGSAEEGGEKSGEDTKKGVKRKRKITKKKSKPRRENIVHSAPQRVRDCFQLAITYMNEPKIASARRIKQYLEDYYDFTNDAKLKKILEDGTEKGWWDLITGSAMAGSYELLVKEFDPTDDDDVMGKIVNALTACSEPKECSAQLLKSYIIDYHPDFKITERPFLFKRALESAVNDDEIRQLSGLGCNGTFQLVEPFIPGPRILAGKDTGSDYEEVTSDEDDSGLDEADEKGFDVSYFDTSNYVPRPSKRRGKARKVGPIEKLSYTPKQATKKRRKAMVKRVAKGGGKRGKYTEDSSEEESDQEEEEEEDSSEEEQESDNEYSKNAEKYKPRPSKSRGSGGKGRGRAASPSPAKKQPAKGRGRPATKGKGRGRPAGKAAAPAPAEKAAPSPAKGRGRPKKRRR